MPALPHTAAYAAALRGEICERGRRFAEQHRLPHVTSCGAQPVVVFSPHDANLASPDGALHGNFLPATYRAILANREWRRRLAKVHTATRSSLPRHDRGPWRELDSCTSSDALLMNVFCYPGVFRGGRLSALLGLVVVKPEPQFGVRARVPLAAGRQDRTEIDMRLGPLLLEAKLTEFDFQSASADTLNSYRDFAEVFDRRDLPRVRAAYCHDQLIRNVLAAHAAAAAFCLLLDARRPDLLDAWYSVLRCVRPFDLRMRCKVFTWQEIAAVLPRPLQAFLDEKYGIA